jgi:phosphopantothenoylcysteine decarboxylase/phosphopantothenate--cysteine ligase
MNVEMWNHPATRKNVEVLKERGVHFVGPDSGYQACGESGEGRLAEPEEIVRQALAILHSATSLKGCTVLVTAGPTVEDIDPVRFISNRSSGKMGYAIAFEAHRRGAAVDLVSGPTRIEPPRGVNLHRVRSASEMLDRVLELFPNADIIVKAAAVADLTPRDPHLHKIKKQGKELRLDLVPTADILLEITGRKRPGQIIVGFAAESENLIGNAREKLQRKQLDLIVANNITAVNNVFDSDENEVVILDRNRSEISIPRASKNEISKKIWDQIELLREESGKAAPQR